MKRHPTLLDINIRGDFDFENLRTQKIENNIKDIVINETYKAIEYGINKNKNKAEIFEIIDTRTIINLDRSKWKNILNKVIIPFFSDKEDYETCINIKNNLISKL